ncbi:Schizosaccharomyces specific protein [Schizosaccharomyces osmophilus]|uniref:Schizosaccharomyces specific protein n=1 Tax=Schizosaccharomyces osmophilus TaxID=2545709 RepID=A0AAF0ATU1_9SCHI|nr:Schizosaccharomyces specific protein [Schizosaccharomyces osmophilus]WBW70982.1 Schizosaccharomyces specific protein [Schizosaccharomyces osmophilus]
MLSMIALLQQIKEDESQLLDLYRVFFRGKQIKWQELKVDKSELDSYMMKIGYNKRNLILISYAHHLQELLRMPRLDTHQLVKCIRQATAECKRSYIIDMQEASFRYKNVSSLKFMFNNMWKPFLNESTNKDLSLLPISFELSFSSVFGAFLFSVKEIYSMFYRTFEEMKESKKPPSATIFFGFFSKDPEFSSLRNHYERFNSKICKLLQMILEEVSICLELGRIQRKL